MSERLAEFEKKMEEVEHEFDELQVLLASNEVMTDNKLYVYYLKKSKALEEAALLIKTLKETKAEIEDLKEMIELGKDSFLEQSLFELQKQELENENQIKILLSAKTELKKQCAVFEISWKGENEQIQDYLKMFENFSNSMGYTFEKEEFENKLVVKVSGIGAYEDFKNFSGQVKFILRGKESFATVVVLNTNIEKYSVIMDDVEVQTLKADGAGGQHINKTESAVRLKHIPTGIVAECRDERSQTSNKERAFENLVKKVDEYYRKKQEKEIDSQRKLLKNAIFSSSPVMIFDYDTNAFTVTKNKKTYKLKEVLNGELKLLISELNG